MTPRFNARKNFRAIAIETRTEALAAVMAAVALGFLVHALMWKGGIAKNSLVEPTTIEAQPSLPAQAPKPVAGKTFAA